MVLSGCITCNAMIASKFRITIVILLMYSALPSSCNGNFNFSDTLIKMELHCFADELNYDFVQIWNILSVDIRKSINSYFRFFKKKSLIINSFKKDIMKNLQIIKLHNCKCYFPHCNSKKLLYVILLKLLLYLK